MGYDDEKKFQDTHAAGISRILLAKGFQKYLHQEKAGFIVSQFDDPERFPRLMQVRMRQASSALITDPKVTKGMFDKMIVDLRQDGFYVKYGWSHDGTEDRSVLIVSKGPFVTPYDRKKQALLPPAAVIGDLRGTVFNVLTQNGRVAAAQGAEGFAIADDVSGRAVFVSWQRTTRTKITSAADLALDFGRKQVTAYHSFLRDLLPSVLIAEPGYSYGLLLVGITWEDVYKAYAALLQRQWDKADAHARERAEEAAKQPVMHAGGMPVLAVSQEAVAGAAALLERAVVPKDQQALVEAVEAAEDLNEAHELDANPVAEFPTEFEMMADLFVNADQAAEAVREIAAEHVAARDDVASSMERRLHHLVLMAIAAGSPDAQNLARVALSTQTLFFDRK